MQQRVFFYKVKVLKLSAGITLWHSLPSRLCVFFIQFPTQKSLKSFIKKHFFSPTTTSSFPPKLFCFIHVALRSVTRIPAKAFALNFFIHVFRGQTRFDFLLTLSAAGLAQSFLLFSPPIFLLLYFKRISFQPISFRNFNSKKKEMCNHHVTSINI